MNPLGNIELHGWQLSSSGLVLDDRVAGSHWELTGDGRLCGNGHGSKIPLPRSSGRVEEPDKELSLTWSIESKYRGFL